MNSIQDSFVISTSSSSSLDCQFNHCLLLENESLTLPTQLLSLEHEDEYFLFSFMDSTNTKRKRDWKKRRVPDYYLRRRANPFPRILKRDIRRTYPIMIANTFNSGDISMFQNFISQFFVSNFMVQVQTNRSQTSLYEYSGYDFLRMNFMLSFLRFPDFVFDVSNISIIQSDQHDHPRIKFQIFVSGTKTIKTIEPIDSHLLQDIQSIMKPDIEIAAKVFDINNIEDLQYSGTVILSLDSFGRIEQFLTIDSPIDINNIA